MLVAFTLLLLAAVDEPVSVLPPPVITRVPYAPPAPPAPPANGAQPGNVANLVSLFSADDYPVAALRAGEQGTVGVRLTVTPQGRVGACEVISSSGSATLDQATCTILQRRARFKPALDHRGRPTTDYFTQRVRWALPADTSPFRDAVHRMVLRFDGAGSIIGCRFEQDGQGSEMPDCTQFRHLAEIVLAGREDQARGMSLVIERRFEASPSAAAAPLRLSKWDVLLSRAVIEFDVDIDGQVRNCRQLVHEGGAASRDLCIDEGLLEFEPATTPGVERRGRFSKIHRLEPLLIVKPVVDPKADPR